MNSRKALITRWTKIAEILDAQGEINLAGEVRHFARHLPPVLTDKERSALELVLYQQGRRGVAALRRVPLIRERVIGRTISRDNYEAYRDDFPPSQSKAARTGGADSVSGGMK